MKLTLPILLFFVTGSFAQAPGSLPHVNRTLKTGGATGNGSTTNRLPNPQVLPGGPVVGVTGTVWNDANGNGIKDGTENYSYAASSGQTLYAILIQTQNQTGQPIEPVVFKVASVMVNPGSGYNYDIAPLDVPRGYQMRIASLAAEPAVGTPASSLTSALATGYTGVSTSNSGTVTAWQNTNNLVNNLGIVSAETSNVNFGIERFPDTWGTTSNIAQPTRNGFVALSGGSNPPVFAGSDPEDQPSTAVLTGKAVAITSLPANDQLWYNGEQITRGADNINAPSVSNPYKISGFDPAKMQIKFTGTGHTTLSFTYAYIDAAGIMDPTPATYTLSWTIPLPVRLLSFTGRANGSFANLAWTSANEVNFKEYVLERSVDGAGFMAVAAVAARGASVNEYAYADDISKVSVTKVYYRLRLTDDNGRFTYSNVVPLALSKSGGPALTIAPNPVRNDLAFLFSTETGGNAVISVVDYSGKTVLTKVLAVAAGTTSVKLENDKPLASGMYVLRTELNGNVQTQRFTVYR